MRIDVPSTEHWIELRDPESLTAADEDAWQRAVEDAWAAAWQAHPDDPEARQQKVREIAYRTEYTRARRDDLLASLITGWSFTDLPLPYRPEYRSRIPIAAGRLLRSAIVPHEALLNDEDGGDEGGDGPKETGTGGSTSPGTSAERSPSPLPGSAPESTGTVTG